MLEKNPGNYQPCLLHGVIYSRIAMWGAPTRALCPPCPQGLWMVLGSALSPPFLQIKSVSLPIPFGVWLVSPGKCVKSQGLIDKKWVLNRLLSGQVINQHSVIKTHKTLILSLILPVHREDSTMHATKDFIKCVFKAQLWQPAIYSSSLIFFILTLFLQI